MIQFVFFNLYFMGCASVAAGFDRMSSDPIVPETMNCVDQDIQPPEVGRRRRFLDHQPAQLEPDQANGYFSVQKHGGPNSPLVQRAGVPQEAALGKHYTLFPEAAGLLNQAGDQYSCLTHEMVDLTSQAYESPEDALFLCSGRAGTTVSTGSTRLSLHPAAERGGASSSAPQPRKMAAEGKLMKEIADDLTLTLFTSARQTHLSAESDRVTIV